MNKTPSPCFQTPDSGPRAPEHSVGRMHLLMLFATLCWATNIIAGKEALRGFGPLALAQLRVLGAAVVFGILFLGWRKHQLLRLVPRQWMSLGIVALFGITLNQLFFIAGLARTSAVHTGLIVALGPVMVLVLSCLIRMEALTLLKSAGTVVSFCGVAVLTTGKAGHGRGAHWSGDLLLVVGSAVFAYYTILVKKIADRYDTLTLNTIIFVLGSLLMIPFSAHEVLAVRWGALPPQAWLGLAYMVIFGSVLAYLVYAFVLTELSPSRVAAFFYLQPLIAVGLGVWMLAERLTAGVVGGGGLILFGVYLAERGGESVKDEG